MDSNPSRQETCSEFWISFFSHSKSSRQHIRHFAAMSWSAVEKAFCVENYIEMTNQYEELKSVSVKLVVH